MHKGYLRSRKDPNIAEMAGHAPEIFSHDPLDFGVKVPAKGGLGKTVCASSWDDKVAHVHFATLLRGEQNSCERKITEEMSLSLP
jgi:hypothetical protein